MSLGIQLTEIKHVLLGDRWHEVEHESFVLDTYEFMDGNQAVARGDGQLITTVGFMFREPGGQIVAGPLSSILAVQVPRTSR
ncbi:MAG: metal-dependent hydrolase [Chloroflexi bacterium]|nr:MAG: metal-dependent hydrolase [Chloroflexota bacterium]TMG65391.1 MAG: metal-dependent hydrolase [Chloroflexota bacterium]